MPVSTLHPNSVNENESDKWDDIEDYFSYWAKEMDEKAHPLCKNY